MATAGDPQFKPVSTSPLRDASEYPDEIRGYIHPQWQLYHDLAQAIRGHNDERLPSFVDAIHVQWVMERIRLSDEWGAAHGPG